MRKAVFVCFLFLINYFSFSQDHIMNEPNAEKRSAQGFTVIRVESGIDLYITQGSEEAVAVSGSKKEYVDKIRTVVENNVLKIYLDVSWAQRIGWRNARLKAFVSVKTLNEIRSSGGSDVTIKQALTAGNFKLSLSGGADFSGAISAKSINISISGGSDVTISGKVSDLEVHASGGSDFKGYDLVADNAIVKVSGGSDARLTVNKELSAQASGGSDVDYKGSAIIKNVSSSGGGSVSRRG